MSTPPPPEDPPEEPTRPLPPATPPPARVGVERELAAPVEDPYRTELLLDQLRSFRTALAIVGVIAVAALAVAVYAVLTKDEVSDAGAGASSQQVADLADRVDALEADVKTRATKNQVSQLSDDVKALSDDVDKAAKQSESAASSDNGGTDEQARSSIDKLDQSVQTLSQDVKTSTDACAIWRTRPSSNSPDARRRPREAATPSNRPVDHHGGGRRRSGELGRRPSGVPMRGSSTVSGGRHGVRKVARRRRPRSSSV